MVLPQNLQHTCGISCGILIQVYDQIKNQKKKGYFLETEAKKTTKSSTPEGKKEHKTLPSSTNQELRKMAGDSREEATFKSIDDWNLKSLKERPMSRFEQVSNEKGETKITQRITWRDENFLSKVQDYELFATEMYAATGSISPQFGNMLFEQTVNAVYETSFSNRIEAMNGVYTELIALKPRDSFESMLICRMIVLHNQSMHYFMIAAHTESIASQERNLNFATKLSRLYNESLETLNKYRRNGKQEVQVTHVHVNDGGKAIVNSQINPHNDGGQSKK